MARKVKKSTILATRPVTRDNCETVTCRCGATETTGVNRWHGFLAVHFVECSRPGDLMRDVFTWTKFHSSPKSDTKETV